MIPVDKLFSYIMNINMIGFECKNKVIHKVKFNLSIKKVNFTTSISLVHPTQYRKS